MTLPRHTFDLAIIGGIVLSVCAVFWWPSASADGALGDEPEVTAVQPSQIVPIGDAATLGKTTAKIALVEFSDFQCPYCGRFEREALPELISNYVTSGRVLLVFKHFPLVAIHEWAAGAAQAAECARRQNAFWPMHDEMFRHQAELKPEQLAAYATKHGLDVRAFHSCVNGDSVESVRRDRRSADELGVTGTPAFFIGSLEDGRVSIRQRMVGARSAKAFGQVLEQQLHDSAKQ